MSQLKITQAYFDQSSQWSKLALRGYKLALAMTTAGAIVTYTGIGLLYSGTISDGALTTTGGLVSGMCFLQLAKDASDRLEKANDRLDKATAALKGED